MSIFRKAKQDDHAVREHEILQRFPRKLKQQTHSSSLIMAQPGRYILLPILGISSLFPVLPYWTPFKLVHVSGTSTRWGNA